MAREMKDSGIAWIGEIPKGWYVSKLKYCALFVQKKYDDAFGELKYIGLENVESWSGKFVQTESEYDRSQSIVFSENDILWGKLRPYLAKVFHCHEVGCCSGEFAVIRIDNLYSVRYFWNLLISSGFVSVVDSSTYGTKMPRANIEFIKNVEIPIPPLPEQSRIAAYLDKHCAEIDRIMEQTRVTIEEYKKVKQSIITEAVTHGVHGPRKMKDSGIAWVGEIPEEWKVQKGKTILNILERPVLPDDEVVTCFRDGQVTLRSNRREEGFTYSIQEIGYQGIEPGDLVVHGMDGFAGAIGISDSSGTFDIIAKNCPKKLVKSKLHGQFLCAHNNYFSAS